VVIIKYRLWATCRNKIKQFDIADLDLKYLIVRIGISKHHDQNKKWLAPNSFTAQETYLNHA
jgi:hypothetical protein